EAIQMDGFQLSGGVSYTFSDYQLDAGQYVVVASNAEAFRFRYGSRDNVVGIFEEGKLSDSGETILLKSDIGELIHDFNYKSSWYNESNGEGASLEVINLDADISQWRRKSHWRSSAFSGGSPGFPKSELSESPIRVSELMFNPSTSSDSEKLLGFIDNDDFEFIELTNTSNVSHNIKGYELLGAVRHRFDEITLDPGQRVLLVNRLKAFRERYGDVSNVVGEYDGNLNNSSERFVLRDSSGMTVLDFIYSGEWYERTDGNGYSLTPVIRKNQGVMLANKEAWRPSRDFGGTPGRLSDQFFDWVWDNFSESDSFNLNVSGEFEDPDVDGISNIVEYVLCSDPWLKDHNYFG
ncbi:MAG: lamin tail domain-containing protein, partial [Verrucomicrobiota bacterium]|nr:lamin tail domain-containing protein [Verrucomicrobiota bacterium]